MNKHIASGCYFVLPFLVLSLTMFAWLPSELKSLFASSHGYQLSIKQYWQNTRFEEAR